MPTATKSSATPPKTAKEKVTSVKASAAKTKSSNGSTASVHNAAEMTDQVLEQLKNGGQGAIGAVRRFLVTVDDSLAPAGEGPSRVHDVVDSALDMSERMVETGYGALHNLVQSAERTFGSKTR